MFFVSIKCSQCGKECGNLNYKNTKTNDIWCPFCLSLEKKKRLKNYVRPKLRP